MGNSKYVLYGPWFMYPRPIDIPLPAITDTPLFSLDVNESWVSVIIGALKVLLYDGTWNSSDENELAEVTRQVDELLSSWYVKEPVVSVPVGTIVAFAGETVPDKWLACDGATVSRTTYADLFAAIGILWGDGDGETTFQIPNCLSQFLRGYNPNVGPHVGEQHGAEYQHLGVNNLPAHHHQERTVRGSTPWYNDAFQSVSGGTQTKQTIASTQITNSMGTPLDTADTGDGDTFAIIPIHRVVNWIIYAGV